MKILAKQIDEQTKQLNGIFGGTDYSWANENGFIEYEAEQAYNGNWYLSGHCPVEPEKTYVEKRLAEYPAISEQLDMIYWDKVNGTNLWQEKIAEIKSKYPKDA